MIWWLIVRPAACVIVIFIRKVMFVDMDDQNRPTNERSRRFLDRCGDLGVGIAFGAALGAGLGVAMGNTVIGIGIGVALGIALGEAFRRR